MLQAELKNAIVVSSSSEDFLPSPNSQKLRIDKGPTEQVRSYIMEQHCKALDTVSSEVKTEEGLDFDDDVLNSECSSDIVTVANQDNGNSPIPENCLNPKVIIKTEDDVLEPFHPNPPKMAKKKHKYRKSQRILAKNRKYKYVVVENTRETTKNEEELENSLDNTPPKRVRCPKGIRRLYSCAHCQKIFKVKSDFTRHLRIHTGEKPFRCEDCGKSFRQKGQLAIHERVHTGAKPYQRNLCPMAFSQPTSLARHERSHTREKPYSCSICGKRYSDLKNYRRHQKNHCSD